MAKSLKTNGLQELSSLKKRTIRQRQLGRIREADKAELIAMINKLEAHIIDMSEEGDDFSWP